MWHDSRLYRKDIFTLIRDHYGSNYYRHYYKAVGHCECDLYPNARFQCRLLNFGLFAPPFRTYLSLFAGLLTPL